MGLLGAPVSGPFASSAQGLTCEGGPRARVALQLLPAAASAAAAICYFMAELREKGRYNKGLVSSGVVLICPSIVDSLWGSPPLLFVAAAATAASSMAGTLVVYFADFLASLEALGHSLLLQM